MSGDRHIIQIVEKPERICDAGPKALMDVTQTIDELGVRKLVVNRHSSNNCILQNIFRFFWIVQSIYYRHLIDKGSILFIQFPGKFFTGSMGFYFINENLKRNKNLKIIALVHDINSQRFGLNYQVGKLSNAEKRFFEMADVLIVLNSSMKSWLMDHGIDGDKMVVFGLWDYRMCAPMCNICEEGLGRMVAIAGNLDPLKCSYLEKISTIKGIQWNLYGSGFNKDRIGSDNVIYQGCYTPDELPLHIKANFGLVWDGHSIETCEGGFGSYLKLNCSHKLSLFLALGIPVLIWEHAAAAKYVLEYDVGWTISSLRQIPRLLDEISNDEYRIKVRNARNFAQSIRDCDHIKESFKKSLQILARQ